MSRVNKNKPIEGEMDAFQKIVDEMIALKERKGGDYANSWKVGGIEGINYQLLRKLSRIWINKNKKEEELNFEMLRDSYMDLAVYSIMGIQLIDSGEKTDLFIRLLKGEIK